MAKHLALFEGLDATGDPSLWVMPPSSSLGFLRKAQKGAVSGAELATRHGVNMRTCTPRRPAIPFSTPPICSNTWLRASRTAALAAIVHAFLAGIAAGAEQESISAVFEPANFIADNGSRAAEGTLLLKNRTPAPLRVRVMPSALLFNGAAAQGTVHIGLAEGRDDADVTLTPGGDETVNWARLPVRVSQLLRLGTYQTGVQLSWSEDSKVNSRVLSLSVLRPAPDFGVMVRGSTGTADAIEITPITKDDSNFSFTVDNPTGGRELDLILEVIKAPLEATGPVTLSFEPASFHLIPGGQRTVTVTLSPLTSSAVAAGRFRIADAAIPGVQKEIPISIKPSFRTWNEIGLLLLMVLIGALVSILTGIVLPAAIRKQNGFDRLRRLRAQINEKLDEETPVCLALLTQQRRAEDANARVWPLGPRAAEMLDAVKQLTNQLEEDLRLASEIKSFRTHVTDMSRFPLSLVPKIIRLLDNADTSIVAGERESAKETLKTAQTEAKKVDDLSAVRSKVLDYISKLPENPLDTPDDKWNDKWIRDRALKLKADAPNVSKLELPDLIKVDTDCYIAYLYLQYFDKDVLQKHHDFESQRADLLKALAGDQRGIREAVLRIESMSKGVVPEDVEEALKRKQIVVEPSQEDMVSTDELVTFSLKFRDPAVDEAPIVKLLGYHWNFGDATKPRHGKTVSHYYRSSIFKSPRKPENVSGIVTVTPNAPITGDPVPHEFTIKVRQRRSAFQLPLLDALTFCLPLALAIVLAVSSHSGDALTFGSLNDYMTPFLWGFGLDQIKQQAIRLQG